MKTTKVLKAILFGALTGTAIYFVPFPFRFFLGFLLIFFAIRFFAFSRWRRGYNERGFNHFWNPLYTQRWRSMSDDERKTFIRKMENELFANTPVTE